MKHTREQLQKEFEAIDKIKVFEIRVTDRRTGENDYILFDITANDEGLRAEHVGLTVKEEDSNKIAFKLEKWDDCFSLDEHLQGLLETCTNAIHDSSFYLLAP